MRRLVFLVFAVVLALLSASAALAGGQVKVDVCHRDGTGYHLINISENAVDQHVAHGDHSPGEAIPEMAGYVFDENCAPILVPETIYAVAYVDVIVDDGSYNPAVDVLIAKLVEANDDGVLSAGDRVVTGQYPLEFDAPNGGYEEFTVTEFVSTTVLLPTVDVPGICGARVGDFATGASFVWFHEITAGHAYEEYAEWWGTSSNRTSIEDHEYLGSGPFPDEMERDTASPSAPFTALSWTQHTSSSDDQFIDVELSCPIQIP